MTENGPTLREVLEIFRDITDPANGLTVSGDKDDDGEYILTTDIDNITVPASTADGKTFTAEMKGYLQNMTKKVAKDGRQSLVLSKQKYQFKELVASVNDSVNVVVAVPISLNKYDDDYLNKKLEESKPSTVETGSENADTRATDSAEEVVDGFNVCLQPIEVRLRVSANAPGLFHGFDIDYPQEIVDVPIRMGLRQIQQTWGGALG